ncbi:MAG TPA: MarR family transcriptional regulator [Burkholderiales bacterium]|nr:MarR family transcriptional regulator [Burkholderiales bacterium]
MAKNPPETIRSAWPLFVTTHAAVVARIEAALAGAGLPELAWYDVLWAIERSPEQKLRLHELARELVFSRSNLTRLVDRIEEARLVKRERAEDDRRGYYAVITAAGVGLRKKMWPVYSKAIEAYFDRHLTQAENTTVRGVLRRVLDAAREPWRET